MAEVEKGVAPGADFSFASSDFKTLGAFFCNFATLSFLGRQPEPRTVSRAPAYQILWVEASEPIPFPGADSIFSSRCGAISGRRRFAVSDETPRFERSTIGSGSSPGRRRENKCRTTTQLWQEICRAAWELRNFPSRSSRRLQPVSASGATGHRSAVHAASAASRRRPHSGTAG